MTEAKLENPLLVAQDLSAVGSLSLNVANPILAAFGLPLAVAPTSLLSTQTEGFETPAKLSTDGWLESSFKHWQQQNIQLSGALIGYLGTDELVTQISNFLSGQQLTQVVIDPVMADQHELYPGLPQRYSVSMKTLLQYATIIVPNVTEAQLLAEIVVSEQPSENEQVALIKALQQMMPKNATVIITDVHSDNEVGCVWIEDGEFSYFGCPRLDEHFFGSGDVFAALLTGFISHGEPIGKSVRLATRGTYETLQLTLESQADLRYGINISGLLGKISNYAQNGLFPM